MGTRDFQLPISGFTDGLNTEASVLNILPSEMMDGTINVELKQNGSVRRRRGVDFIAESDAGGFLQLIRASTISAETRQESPISTVVRLTAPNGNLIERLVVDLNNEFHIFEMSNSGLKNIDTPSQVITRTTDSHDDQKFEPMMFAQSGNKLFFNGKHTIPGFLSIDTDNISLKATYYDVLIRNPNATKINTRRSRSGNWFECIEAHTSSIVNRPGDGTGDWEQFWFELDGEVPGGTSAWATSTSYSTTFVKQYNKRNIPAASDTFPTTVEFFAGRVWLSGDSKNPNDIFFSQVIAKDSDIEKFHQFADPFDTTDPELVDDDGGVISLQGSAEILQLLTSSSAIFIGTGTGVWQIFGQDGIFKATSFTNIKVLEDRIVSGHGMVRVGPSFVVFGQDSIWRAVIESSVASAAVGRAAFTSLSQDRIETLYKGIPEVSKASALSVYNPSSQELFYFVNKVRTNYDNSFNSSNTPGYFTHVLVLNTRFSEDILSTVQPSDPNIKRVVRGAFTLYEFDDGAATEKPFIASPFVGPDVPIANEPVVIGGDPVTVSADPVVISTVDAKKVVHFLALQRDVTGSVVDINGAFGTFDTLNLQDWTSDSNFTISYVSQIVTGVQTLGNVMQRKGVRYLHFVFNRVESDVLDAGGIDLTPGGCLLNTAWDFSVNSNSPNFDSTARQIYFPHRFTHSVAGSGDEGVNHVQFKHRVRGTGNTLQLYLLNDGDKDFHLIGWMEQLYGQKP